MNSADRSILNLIQGAFPVDPRPYKKIGAETGMSEHEAFQRIQDLKEKKIIRRIGGIFDSRNLGYVSTLCAAKVPQEKIPILAEIMQGMTEITHNYLRNHHYNMWFTIIASSYERMEQILNQIKTVLGSDEVYSLPALKMFKIEVRLPLLEEKGKGKTTEEAVAKGEPRRKSETSYGYVFNEDDKALIRKLQDNLPQSLTPYSELSKELDIEEEEVLARIRDFLQRGILRRLVAILYHQKAGFTSNVMGAWCVSEEAVNEVGVRMARFNEVSHCYQRPSFPDFPYNLFTMIHCQSDQECKDIIARMSKENQIKDYTLLFSQAELKKSSMKYFAEKDA